MERTEVNVSVKVEKLMKFDWPVSFVCGREMIEKIGSIEPEKSGILCLVFHRSEMKESSDWIPDVTDMHRVHLACLPDDVPFSQWIIEFFGKLSISPATEKTWDLKTLRTRGVDASGNIREF